MTDTPHAQNDAINNNPTQGLPSTLSIRWIDDHIYRQEQRLLSHVKRQKERLSDHLNDSRGLSTDQEDDQ